MIIDDDKKDPKQNKDSQAQPPVPQPPAQSAALTVPAGIDPTVAALLAQLAEQSRVSMAREERLKKLEDEEDARKKARSDRYALNRQQEGKGVREIQSRCRHLKGGKFRRKNAVVDYGLGVHTYINGSQDIRCLVGCRMRWIPSDTREAIIRDGAIYPNHTKLGWSDVMSMALNESSNEVTKSETAIRLTPEQMKVMSDAQTSVTQGATPQVREEEKWEPIGYVDGR